MAYNANGPAVYIKASFQPNSTPCLRKKDGTASQGGNVQYIYDQCDTANRFFCDPFIDDKTLKYNASCSKNSSQFEYFPTYI